MFIKVVASQLQKDNLLQLILTDFTPNKLPMARHYQSDDMIPSELLIQASLWDENATACLGIENGDYIELHNAQIKLSKLGYMELAVNGDRTSGKKEPKVKKISNIYNNPKVKHILQLNIFNPDPKYTVLDLHSFLDERKHFGRKWNNPAYSKRTTLIERMFTQVTTICHKMIEEALL